MVRSLGLLQRSLYFCRNSKITLMSVLANKAWQIKGLPQTALMFDSSTLGSNLCMKTEIGLEFRFQYGEQDSNVCREATFDVSIFHLPSCWISCSAKCLIRRVGISLSQLAFNGRIKCTRYVCSDLPLWQFI